MCRLRAVPETDQRRAIAAIRVGLAVEGEATDAKFPPDLREVAIGFGGIAGDAACIAKILLVVFVVLFLISAVMGQRTRV